MGSDADAAGPAVSVLVPVRDPAPFLAEAVASVLEQHFDHWELVAVLDGPSPGAAETLAAFDDPRVRTVAAEHPRGLGAALNTGLAHCRAELVARLDADDLCLPGRLSRQVGYLSAHPDVGVLGSPGLLINPSGRQVGMKAAPSGIERVERALRWHNVMVHPSVMYRRRLVEEVGGYDEGLTRVEDYDLWLRLLGRTHIDNLPDPVVAYRVHPGQHSQDRFPRTDLDHVRRARLAAARAAGTSLAMARMRHAAWRRFQVRYDPRYRLRRPSKR